MTSFSSNAVYAGARLLLYGETLDPADIEETLSMKADSSFRKGDRVSGEVGSRRHGMWSVKHRSTAGSFTEDLEYFSRLLSKLSETNKRELGVDNTRVSLWINEKANSDSSSLEIDIDDHDVRKLSSLGAQLYITYFNDIDDV